MPSPIAHTTMGYLIYKIFQARRPKHSKGRLGLLPRLLLVMVGLSLLPDLDSVVGLLLRDFGRYHNNGSHSLFIGLAVAFVISGLVWWKKRSGVAYWFVVVLLCYQFHIILDFFTFGRGVMLFWPLSSARFASPLKLFYGFHWSDGLISINHVWTALSELGFAAVAIFVMSFLERRVSWFRPTSYALNQSRRGIREGS